MRRRGCLSALILALWAVLLVMPPVAQAAFNSGSTGEDGAFEPTAANTVLQIPESGVFNFTTVNIPSGVTVTFKKNEQNTGVTMLASGNVTINGTIDLNGKGGSSVMGGAGGPGGFDGGSGGLVNGNGRRGQGPGCGTGGTARTSSVEGGGSGGGGGYGGNGGAGGGYYTGSPGGAGGAAYSNDRILPLMGGSGGAGGGGTSELVGGAGGGGGGAIVIASSGTITVNGSIAANGGNGAAGEGSYYYYGSYTKSGAGGGGAGGAIRLIANTIAGNGALTAVGGSGGLGFIAYGGAGASGRIRLETPNNLRTSAANPPVSVGFPSAVIPSNMPSLAVTSIGGIEVPAVPRGALGGPDVLLPFNIQNPITVVVSGVNIPEGSMVTLKATPEMGTVSTASGALTGSGPSSSVSIPIDIATAYPSLITATVTFQLTAANGGPFYVNGEKVDRVRVAAVVGGASSVVYITESGKEITAEI